MYDHIEYKLNLHKRLRNYYLKLIWFITIYISILIFKFRIIITKYNCEQVKHKYVNCLRFLNHLAKQVK